MISSLSVVVPAYNEEENVVRAVLPVDAALRQRLGDGLEWLIVDDGSTDGTDAEIARLASMTPNVAPLRHDERKGVGAAIWTGMARASMEWCAWLPADGQFEPQCFVEMVELAGENDCLLVMRHESQRESGRRVLTMVFSGLMRAAFGFDPYGFSGIFMGKRQSIQRLPMYASTGVQNYAVAICLRKEGCRMQQVYTVTRPRLSGRSKVANMQTTLRVLYEILKLRLTI